LPPLRQRPEEIPQLADRFLRRISIPNQTPPFLLESTINELCRRQWPGNVRELRNAIEHGALMARGGAIAPEHLPPASSLGESPSADPATQVHEAVRNWAQHQLAASKEHFNLHELLLNTAEPALFETVLAATGQNRAQAAGIL